jgi:hypothetical protein
MKSDVQTTFIKKTLELRDHIEGAFLELGSRLMKIRNEKMWAGEYESFGEFLEEMRISEATASKMIAVYSTYVVTHKMDITQLAKAGWSNLYSAIPLLESKKYTIDEVLERAITWRRVDIQNEVREESIGEHRHDWNEYHFKICSICREKQGLK